MDRYEKSLQTLELPAVLELLAQQASGEAAKAACRAIRPAEMEYEVRKRLGETSAAKAMMVLRGAPGFSGVRDVRGPLARADMGGVLNTRELLQIASTLQCARTVRAYGEGDESGRSELGVYFRGLSPNRYLEEKISTSILGEDELADTASGDLADIRRKLRVASARVREALQKIISSPSYAKALQEPIITTRSDRFVVPVKSEQRAAVPGLVHDVSASGATVFIEPMAAVKANNDIRELRAKEKLEIERILAELSAECASFRESIERDFSILTELDVIFAKAKLSYNMDGDEPEVSGGELRLRRARHPLLPKGSAVPIDVVLGGDYDSLVITGPNTGGKTVSIKTMGLLSVMALCGLHIPAADGSCVPLYRKVLADIGDEQSIEQNLSTFSAHMTNIVEILAECGEGTLLLFDELGAGTDPTEGAALAIAIIERARAMGACVAATTHYAELKVYATTQKGVQNACCEFDVETLRPTYRLLIGIPGKSNAFAISRRLGLPEDIIEDAKSRVGTASASMEEVLEKLEYQRQLLERDRLEEAKKRREAEENAKRAAQLRAELEVRYEKADEKARREAQRILDDARRQAEAVFDELDRIRKLEAKTEDHREVNELRAALRRNMNEADERLAEATAHGLPQPEQRSARPAKAGDTVRIKSMGVTATVISAAPDGSLLLQAGILKVNAKQDEVLLLNESAAERKPTVSRPSAALRSASLSPEIDLRGMMSDEAVLAAERYIDAAVMAKLKQVTIIHGKGTGALRTAVQAMLKKNRLVKSYRLGVYGEGETGVTVVELK
ncbi:MAG: endonuclease MutS2 [Oscillospiraceae bacterium]|nr:endonuclease MutS2 [Oscillospiraceae bacterium]